MGTHNVNRDQINYVQFTAKPKKGNALRYLLMTQVRKRFLQQSPYNWRRQVKAAALTGDPERLIEVYRVPPRTAAETLRALNGWGGRAPYLPGTADKETGDFDEESSKLFFQEEIKKLVPKEGLSEEYFVQMDYMGDAIDIRRDAWPSRPRPYLLHTTIALDNVNNLNTFSELNSRLLSVFARHGLRLVVAGQRVVINDDKLTFLDTSNILNIWDFESAEQVESLMMLLADNSDYFKLNEMGKQEQHILRNVSRHYQFAPLLGSSGLASGVSA